MYEKGFIKKPFFDFKGNDMKHLVVLMTTLLVAFSASAAKDDRYKKGEVSAEVAQEALQSGAVEKFGKTPFSKVIPQSITVNGVYQPEDARKATIYFTYVAKGSDAARSATAEVIQFNSDYWYFPASGQYLKK